MLSKINNLWRGACIQSVTLMMMLRMILMASCRPVLHCMLTSDMMYQSSIGVPCHRHKYGITEDCLSRPAIILTEAPVEPLQPAVDQSARPLEHPAQPAAHTYVARGILRGLSHCVQGSGA